MNITDTTPRDSALVSLDVARIALARAEGILSAHVAVSAAGASILYLERAQAGQETIAKAREIRLRAERRLGEFLLAAPVREGRPPKTVPAQEQFSTLSDFGISRKRAMNARRLASMPKDEFESLISGTPRKKGTSERIRRISQFDSRLSTVPAPEPDAACAELVTLIGTMQAGGWRGVRPQMARALTILTLMARRDGYSLRVVAETALLDVP